MQTRIESFIENVVNVLIGFLTALASQIIIFPFFNIYVSITENILLTFYFTIVSLIRGYLVRRYYNRKQKSLN